MPPSPCWRRPGTSSMCRCRAAASSRIPDSDLLHLRQDRPVHLLRPERRCRRRDARVSSTTSSCTTRCSIPAATSASTPTGSRPACASPTRTSSEQAADLGRFARRVRFRRGGRLSGSLDQPLLIGAGRDRARACSAACPATIGSTRGATAAPADFDGTMAEHAGWGISVDQRVGDGVTLFGRYGDADGRQGRFRPDADARRRGRRQLLAARRRCARHRRRTGSTPARPTATRRSTAATPATPPPAPSASPRSITASAQQAVRAHAGLPVHQRPAGDDDAADTLDTRAARTIRYCRAHAHIVPPARCSRP